MARGEVEAGDRVGIAAATEAVEDATVGGAVEVGEAVGEPDGVGVAFGGVGVGAGARVAGRLAGGRTTGTGVPCREGAGWAG